MRIIDAAITVFKTPFTGLRAKRFLKPIAPTTSSDVPNPVAKLFQKTKLDIARDQLKEIDQKIAFCLGKHFKACANPNINPTTEMVAAIQFPTEIENLAIERNTPKELFAGVALFLALKINPDDILASRKINRGQNKLEEFKELCHLLCDRHEASRLVLEHKLENREQFNDDDGKVITFIPEQHQKVISRMHRTSTLSSYDGDLSSNIIGWVAATNAGWQDMAINENTGPFIVKVAAKNNYEIRDPRPALAA